MACTVCVCVCAALRVCIVWYLQKSIRRKESLPSISVNKYSPKPPGQKEKRKQKEAGPADGPKPKGLP